MKTKTKGKSKVTPDHVLLAQFRERMGFTVGDAAQAIGCSRQAWHNWENDKIRVPAYIRLAMSAVALGMPPYGASPNGEE